MFDDIYYWAPLESRTEVDFLLTRDNEYLAIETKATSRYNTGLLKGLRAIEKLPGLARRVLVYDGARTFRTEDGIEIWTVARLLEALQADSLWP